MQVTSDTLTKSVRDALDARLKGEQAPFDFLVQKLRQASVDGTPARLLQALTTCAPTLAQEPEVFRPIIDEVLNSPMAHLVEGIRHAHTAQSFEHAAQKAREAMRPLLNFLAGLVSVNSALLPSVFHSIAQKLLPRDGDGSEDSDDEGEEGEEDDADGRAAETPGQPSGTSSGPGVPHLTVRRLRRRARPWEREEPRIEGLYGCTHSLLMLVPTGLPSLFEALRASFPHRRHGVHTHRAYTRRLLRLAQALPALEDRLLSIVVDRMVDIDVEISIRDVDEQQDPQDSRRGSQHPDGSDNEARIETLADKLDVMVELVFQYLDEKCGAEAGAAGVGCADHAAVTLAAPTASASSSSSAAEASSASIDARDLLTRRRKHALALVLAVFERSVLPTHKSRFTQFIVFYMCRLSAQMADTFAGRLINNLRNRTLPLVLRVACASYVGSFLSRAKFVDDSTVRSALFYLLGYAHRFLDESEQRQLAEAARQANASSSGGGQARIGPDGETIRVSPGGGRAGLTSRLYSPTVFLSVCQACFYILAFRARSLAQSPEALAFLRELRFGRIVSSQEDPLRRCLDSVSREFVRVAINLQLVTDREVRQSAAGASLLVLPEDSIVSEDDDADGDDGSSVAGNSVSSGGSGSGSGSDDSDSETDEISGRHDKLKRQAVTASALPAAGNGTVAPTLPHAAGEAAESRDLDGTSTGSGISRRSASSDSGRDVDRGVRSVSAAPAAGAVVGGLSQGNCMAVRLIEFKGEAGVVSARSTAQGILGRSGSSSSAASAALASEGDSLDSLKEYFPFDPFRLRRSKHFLKGLYRRWEDVELRDEDLPEDLRRALYGEDGQALHEDASDEGERDDEDDGDEEEEEEEEDEVGPLDGARIPRIRQGMRRGSIGSASSGGSGRRSRREFLRTRSESMAGGVGFSLEDEDDISDAATPNGVADHAASRSKQARHSRRAGSHASRSGAESVSAAELSADMAKEAEGLGRVGRTLDQLGHAQATYTEAMRSRIAEMGGLEHVDPLSDLDSGIASGSAAEEAAARGGAGGRPGTSEVMYELGAGAVTVDELGLGSHSADRAALLSARLEGITGAAPRGGAAAGRPSGSAGGGRSRAEERLARAVRRQKVVRAALAEDDGSDGRSLEPSPLIGPAGSPLSLPTSSPPAASAGGGRGGAGGGILPPLRMEPAAAGMGRREEGERGYRRASLTNSKPEADGAVLGSALSSAASSAAAAWGSGTAEGTSAAVAHGVRVPGRMEADDELAVGIDQARGNHLSSKASVKSHISGPPPMDEMAWLLSTTTGAATEATSRHTSGAERGEDSEHSASGAVAAAGSKRARPDGGRTGENKDGDGKVQQSTGGGDSQQAAQRLSKKARSG